MNPCFLIKTAQVLNSESSDLSEFKSIFGSVSNPIVVDAEIAVISY